MRKTTFQFGLFFPVLLSAAVFLLLHSCKNSGNQIDCLSKKLSLRQDSLKHVFFIPTKENLKSELTFYHGLLSDFEKISPSQIDSIRFDSLTFFVKNQIEKTKARTTDLESYDLRNIIETQFSKEVFLQKNI